MNTGLIHPFSNALHPYVYDEMSLTHSDFYFLFHGDIDLICSELSISECLKGLGGVYWHESQVPQNDMTYLFLMYVFL